ncbi:hypothetical protein [Paraburkholderia sp. J76]|uniref:hypothetical protein n=1 Tax=Paraburkholderia sp. J76 TaxID=2805439 RepID=UPI002ABD91ED|nr:hypothetical protein [Paraburkholderia sp. J76]
MREELSNILRERYPLIFAVGPVATDTADGMPTVFSLWGFGCGDGWFDLIDVLCARLQLATRHGAPQVVASQVKEKFGTLRFSASGADARQRAMIELAEMMSGRLCEQCGNPGQTISAGWMRTRCTDHSTNSWLGPSACEGSGKKVHRSIGRTGNITIDPSSEAVAAVINGTEWLTAETVGRRHDPEATDLLAVTNQWQKESRIFAVELAGQPLYPAYLFDETGNPIPEVAEILGVFAGYSPFRIAAWFESTCGMLHGKRPREVLTSDAKAAVAAAKDHVVGPVHG